MCDLGDVTLPLPQYHILVIIADGQVSSHRYQSTGIGNKDDNTS